jgi:hypothetical protein
MNFHIDNANSYLKNLQAAYQRNSFFVFETTLNATFIDKLKPISRHIDEIYAYYNSGNNLEYIEQVMSDSLKVMMQHTKDVHNLDYFLDDINFAIHSANDLFDINFGNIDILTDDLIKLYNIKAIGESVLNYINDEPSFVQNQCGWLMQEFIGTVFDLIKILEKQVYQLDYMQSSSMDMMNKIKRIQKNVVKVRRDSDEDDD